MKDTGININDFLSEKGYEVDFHAYQPYALSWALFREHIPNGTITISEDSVVKVQRSGINIRPSRSNRDICIGSLKRNYSSVYKTAIVHVKVSWLENLPKIDSRIQGLTKEIGYKFYTYINSMGLLAKETTKNRFMNGYAVVNLSTNDVYKMYSTIVNVRALRDEPLFVRRFVKLVDCGLDKFVAYVAATAFIRTTSHWLIRSISTFVTDRGKYTTSFKSGFIVGLYRMKVMGNIDIPVRRRATLRNMSIHENLSRLGNNLPDVSAAVLIKYGNTISKSVKLASNRNDYKAASKCIAKASAYTIKELYDE